MAELSEEVIEFLSAGTRPAMLGYVATDGRPLVAPVWIIVDNGELVFNTARESAKGRALARDSRVVICGRSASALLVRAGAGNGVRGGRCRRPARDRDPDRRTLHGCSSRRGNRPAQRRPR
jgi:Pyridoxamine 5'-phosphate oxidase